jgi:hypothetical protein
MKCLIAILIIILSIGILPIHAQDYSCGTKVADIFSVTENTTGFRATQVRPTAYGWPYQAVIVYEIDNITRPVERIDFDWRVNWTDYEGLPVKFVAYPLVDCLAVFSYQDTPVNFTTADIAYKNIWLHNSYPWLAGPFVWLPENPPDNEIIQVVVWLSSLELTGATIEVRNIVITYAP